MQNTTIELQKIKTLLQKSALVCEENLSHQQLEQALFSAETATIKLRNLYEEICPHNDLVSKKQCPVTKYAGQVEVNEFGWLHITLNSLLPHCKYKTPQYLSDTLSRMLATFKEKGGKLPYFKKATLIIDEHCNIQSRQVYDEDNKGWKSIPNALKGLVVVDDDQFSLELCLLSTLDETPSCHIYVMDQEDVSDYFALRNDKYNHYF